MKKLVSLISVLLCAVMLSTTVFAASPDPLTLYRKCQKNFESNIKSMDISVSQKMTRIDLTEYETEPDDMLKQDIRIKMRKPAEKQLEIEVKTRDSYTREITNTYYYKDGYAYMESLGEKFKVKMGRAEAIATFSVDLEMNLTEDMLKTAKIEMLDEGMKVTCVTKLKDLPKNHPMIAYKDIDEVGVTFSSVTTRVIIGYDGMLKSGSNSLNMKMDGDYLNANYRLTQSFKVNSYNSVDVINFPNDFGSYKAI